MRITLIDTIQVKRRWSPSILAVLLTDYVTKTHWRMASLRGETPYAIMDTVDGCRIALFMLETFHDWNVLTTTAVPE